MKFLPHGHTHSQARYEEEEEEQEEKEEEGEIKGGEGGGGGDQGCSTTWANGTRKRAGGEPWRGAALSST